MAKAVATMLTESEAARLCGIEPRSWFEWKSRAGRSGKFAGQVEAYSAAQIDGLLKRVQKSADGVDVKFPDFRAALALLKFKSQQRFGDSPPAIELHQHTHQLSPESKAKVEALLLASLQPVVESKAAPAQIQDAQIVSSDESNPS
jgi:hypothetical protein